ncbi:MAG TPA: cation transporting ATPase C-terminal domain-containing protein, partial [archaeon]|nr:cation transporting ATPase C-terminal domain-containing protein [archaeon]
ASGSLLAMMAMGIFTWQLVDGTANGLDPAYVLDKARTATITVTIMAEMFLVFNCRSERKSITEYSPFSNRYLLLTVALSILIQVIVIYVPFFQGLLGMVPLDLMDWARIITLSSLALVLSPRFFLGFK